MEGNLNMRSNNQREERLSFEEHTWGTSWPARNYACSFCKREFRSAQALGGHMNVHRRDRARLRSCSLSSWVNSSECPKLPNHNPSPSPLSESPLPNSPLYSPCLTLSSSSLASSASPSGDKKLRLSSSYFPLLMSSPQNREIKMSNTNNTTEEEEHKVFKKNEQNVTLQLGIGLLSQQEDDDDKLDLELRLGL